MNKRLYRSRTDKQLAGVCGGLGKYFDIDPTIIRLAWVIAAFCAGGGIIAYILAMIIVPVEPELIDRQSRLSLRFEVIAYQRPAFFCKDAGRYFCAGMKQGGGEEAVAAPGVGRPIDYSADLAPVERRSAHGARLYGNIQSAVLQIFSSEGIRRGSDGLHLGVSSDIMQRLREVVRARQYPAATHHHSPDGYLTLGGGLLSLGYRLAHILLVCGHVVCFLLAKIYNRGLHIIISVH